MISPRPFHPWHDIPTGQNVPESLTAVVEIPANGFVLANVKQAGVLAIYGVP